MRVPALLSPWLHRKLLPALVVLEVALSCAIIANMTFVTWTRIQRMEAETGLDEAHVVAIGVSDLGSQPTSSALIREDLDALRRLPDVTHAVQASQFPFGPRSSSVTLRLDPVSQKSVNDVSLYMGTEGVLQAMGLHLIGGRDFTTNEYIDSASAAGGSLSLPSSAIITTGLARTLFNSESVLGKQFYVGDRGPVTIVGVVDKLAPPYVQSAAAAQLSILLPAAPESGPVRFYLLRTSSHATGALAESARGALMGISRQRLIPFAAPLTDLRSGFFRRERSANLVLAVAVVATLLVLTIGVHGLARFSIVKRQQEIGIRRALGGRVSQLLRAFQAENLALMLIGSIGGIAGALLVNVLIVKHFGASKLPGPYVLGVAFFLIVINQLSILPPTWRAAHLPPAIASRGTHLKR